MTVDAWEGFLRRRRYLRYSLLSILVIAFAVELLGAPAWVNTVLFLAWAPTAAWAFLRVAFFDCPNCQRRYHDTGGIGNVLGLFRIFFSGDRCEFCGTSPHTRSS